MKYSKAILSIILVTASIIGTIAIGQGDPDPEDLIVGEWLGVKPEGLRGNSAKTNC